MNKAILIGRVGKTPDIKEINGVKCAIFSLATSERYKDRNGEVKELTEWHNIVVWRATAEYCEKYVSVGDTLCIEGKIKYRTWETDRGEKRYATDIVADHLQTLGRKQAQEQAQEQAQAGNDDDLPL